LASTPYSFTHAEELAHAWSHGAGALLSVFGLTWMLYIAIPTADGWRIAASVVYGTSLILLFLSSTIYHALYASPRKHIYKLVDHCAIYLLIAGTYTPFLLVAMRDSLGWWLFGAIWALATAGVITKLWFRHRYPKLSLAGYLIMGWLVVFAAPQIVDAIGRDGMWWLIAGGLSYTIGAVFYSAQRIRYHHVIWHAFVLTGGVCHFMAVVRHVLPPNVVPAVSG
jgi:hemolysin III